MHLDVRDMVSLSRNRRVQGYFGVNSLVSTKGRTARPFAFPPMPTTSAIEVLRIFVTSIVGPMLCSAFKDWLQRRQKRNTSKKRPQRKNKRKRAKGVSILLCKRPGFVFGDGVQGKGAIPLPLHIDVETFCGFMMQLAPGPASALATGS